MKQLKGSFLFITMFLGACSGTRTGNPYSSGLVVTASSQAATALAANPSRNSFGLESLWAKIEQFFVNPAWSLPPPSSMIDASGNFTVDMTQAWIVLKEIEFEKTESGAGEGEIALTGPYVIDLFSATPASLGTANLDAGPYKRIKFKLEHEETLSADAPSELAGKSLYFAGSENGHAFSYRAADGTEVEVGGSTGVTPDASNDLVLLIRLAKLVSFIDLTALDAAGDRNISDDNRITATNPCPLIDESAADLFTCFRKGIESTANFGRDSDGDHELESGEDSVRD